MSDEEIKMMFKSLNIPIEYHHFSEDVSPPFMIYVDEPPTIIRADGIIFKSIRNVTFELYTDEKDQELITQVEKTLLDNGIRYTKSEDWIESELMYEFAFFTQP